MINSKSFMLINDHFHVSQMCVNFLSPSCHITVLSKVQFDTENLTTHKHYHLIKIWYNKH